MRSRARLVAAIAIAIGSGCARAKSNASADAAPARGEGASDAGVEAIAAPTADAVVPSALEAAFAARDDAGRDARDEAPLDASPDDGPLAGARYVVARTFVARYCAECHTERGTNPRKKKALPQQRLDTYEQWRSHASVLRGVLDKWNPDGKTMPPKGARAQPTDDERRAMLDWLARGSPNRVDGKGP